jgi:iron complex outermembrane receptor protein
MGQEVACPRLGRLAAGSIAALISVGVAHAQTPERSSTLEELVVTAERRTENLQTAPVAASVFTEETAAKHNIRTVDDLEFAVPSLTSASNGQSNMMNIRGIGKEDNSGNATSAVAVYRDGVGVISGFATGEPYYDISSIEVLRGPQGTFVGENAAGGAIFINTRDPELGNFGGFFEAGYGNYQEIDLTGAVNLPINDTLAARVAFKHTQRDSFFNVFFDQAATQKNPQDVGAIDLNSARLSLLWRPVDQFTAKVKLDLNDLNYHGYAFGIVPGYPLASSLPPGSPIPTNISDDPFTVGNNSTDNYAVDRMARLAVDLRYTFQSGLQLRSISGVQYVNSYIRNDDDGSATIDRRQHIRAIFRIYTQEFNLISPDTGRFSWIAGAFARRETLWFPEKDGFVLTDYTNYGPNPPPELTIVWRNPRDTRSLFGQVSYKLTDDLTLQAGLRYNDFKYAQHIVVAFPVFALSLPYDDVYKEDKITGKVALNWQANPDNFFYVFAATGNTTGGLAVVASLPPYTNQYTIDYEAGWKAILLDGRVRTQLGGFYNDIKHYQAFFTDAVTGRSTFQNLEGKSKVYGVEFTGDAVLGDLSLDVALAWIHSSLGEGLIFDDVLGEPIQTKGKKQPFTPEYTVHAGAEYTFRLPGQATLTPRVDYAWIDTQTVTPLDRIAAGIPIDRIPRHELVNLQLIYAKSPWTVTGYVTNAFDETYIEAHGGPGYNAYPNEPRRVGLRVMREF